jgi:hypothetical protein
MPDENVVKTAADAVKGIVEAVPVYQDAVQPAARELGKALQTVAKAVHVALAPVSVVIWGYEKISDYLTSRLTELLKDVPPDQIVTPSAHVAGPALEAMRFTADESALRDLFAQLLATAMDARCAPVAHPAFVEIVKQITADEAVLLRFIASKRHAPEPLVAIVVNIRPPYGPEESSWIERRHINRLAKKCSIAAQDLVPGYIDNLSRLGLVRVAYDKELVAEHWQTVYAQLESDLLPRLNNEAKPGQRFTSARGSLTVTDFGMLFMRACIGDLSVLGSMLNSD